MVHSGSLSYAAEEAGCVASLVAAVALLAAIVVALVVVAVAAAVAEVERILVELASASEP